MASHGGMREGSGRPTKTTSLEVNTSSRPTKIELVACTGSV